MIMDKNQKETIEAYNNSAKEFLEKIATLANYNDSYDYLVNILHENDNILDLACGPAQISKYIIQKIDVNVTGVDLSSEMLKIAKNNIPNGIFIEDSIITYRANIFYDLIIIGFGIPYLNNEQTVKCIENSVSLLKMNGHIYISFMDGNISGFEKTSFGGDNNFYIYYHKKEKIKDILEKNEIKIIKEYVMDYKEADGRITKDIILIGEKY
jgi:SAM-dependent methyltransferase